MKSKPINLFIIDPQPEASEMAHFLDRVTSKSLALTRMTRIEEALYRLKHRPFDLILLCIHPASGADLGILSDFRSASPDLPVIVLSDRDDDALALKAINGGAQDFLFIDGLDQRGFLRSIHIAIERKRLEKATREEAESYLFTFEQSPKAMAHVSPGGSYLRVNRSFCEMFGCTGKDIVGLRIANHTHKDDLVAENETINQMLSGGGQTVVYERRSILGDGSQIRTRVSLSPVCDTDGTAKVVLAIFEDITRRGQTSDEVALLGSIVENSNDSIIGVSLEGSIFSWSRGSERIYGYTAEEVIGLDISVIIPQERLDEFRQISEDIRKGKSISIFETLRKRKDGKLLDICLTASPLCDEAGRIIGVSVIGRDITEQKYLEQQLRQAQKMEAIGRLAGGIAHDFNNLLTAIIGYSQVLQARLGPGAPGKKEVAEILSAGQRAARLTNQLLVFSRNRPRQTKNINLNNHVSEIKKMLVRLIGEDITLETILAPEIAQVRADPGQIDQVIMNLVINARDAMPDGGKLTIETTNVELSEAYVAKHIGISKGSYVLLTVSDTGTGMDRETQSRIFEPFFTTKETGQGTGLGLSTVYGIVDQCGGKIQAYSEPGLGTTFKIYLPPVVDVEGAEIKKAAYALPRGTETILLAEDEARVRHLAREILEMYGYKVLEAGHGGEALLICEQHKEAIDLLIADVVMPNMNGRQLADRITLRRGKMKVLYISGYTDHTIYNRGILDKEMAFLQKPFTPTNLVLKVREVLDTV